MSCLNSFKISNYNLMTETYIKVDHPPAIKRDIVPPGYSVHHAHRQSNGKGGGVALILREELQSRSSKLSTN